MHACKHLETDDFISRGGGFSLDVHDVRKFSICMQARTVNMHITTYCLVHTHICMHVYRVHIVCTSYTCCTNYTNCIAQVFFKDTNIAIYKILHCI